VRFLVLLKVANVRLVEFIALQMLQIILEHTHTHRQNNCYAYAAAATTTTTTAARELAATIFHP